MRIVVFILLFVQSKEMPRKTRKVTRKNRRRRTIRQIKKGGSSTTQALAIPSSAFASKIGAPVNSADSWYN